MIPHLETLEVKTLATLLRLYTHSGRLYFRFLFSIKSLPCINAICNIYKVGHFYLYVLMILP